MAEAVVTQPEVTPAVITQPEVTPEVITQPELTPEVENPCKEDVSMDVEIGSDTSNTKTNNSDKREYSEEEKQKRKEYFKELKNSRKLARQKNNNKNLLRRLRIDPILNSSFTRPGKIQLTKSILSRKMSDDEKKMLDYYKVRLSTLRSENESLHKKLAYLVNENMKFLQVFIHTCNYYWLI